jgi:hypothetical protein
MKRVSYFALCTLLASLLTPVFASDEKEKLTGEEIITKHIAAIGGKDAILKFRTRVALGTARKDNDSAVNVAILSEAPNRVTGFYQFEGLNWQLTYDGTRSIFRPVFSRANVPVMQKYMDILATGTMFNDISLYNALVNAEAEGTKFEAKGTKKLKGKPAYLVEMKRSKGDIVRLYFDSETFMWVRSEYGTVRLTKPMSGFTNEVTSKDEETTYDFFVETSEFKEVDGTKLPFRVEMIITAPLLKQKNVGTIVTVINEYKHNIEIDPKMFQ